MLFSHESTIVEEIIGGCGEGGRAIQYTTGWTGPMGDEIVTTERPVGMDMFVLVSDLLGLVCLFAMTG